MTKEQALDALETGKKVKHKYYGADEYLYMEHGRIFTEEGYSVGGKYCEFWSKTQKWESDWSIVDESKKTESWRK